MTEALCAVPADNQDEAWCTTHFLSHASLRLAVVIRAELLEVMQRIELPVSPPAFGCQDNCTNIKRALISGFFLKVSVCFPYSCEMAFVALKGLYVLQSVGSVSAELMHLHCECQIIF